MEGLIFGAIHYILSYICVSSASVECSRSRTGLFTDSSSSIDSIPDYNVLYLILMHCVASRRWCQL